MTVGRFMQFDILTLFPGYFSGLQEIGVIGNAIKQGLLSIDTHNPRDFTKDKHRTVDDSAYGGGPGMIMKPEPIFECLDSIKDPAPFKVLLSPQGVLWSQKLAQQLIGNANRIALICGRYEGVDERVREKAIDLDISIGNYILAGGEAAACIVIETIARLIPGVIGNTESVKKDSLSDGLLKYPQYTRPSEYRGMKVPEILLSGNHNKIKEWRRDLSILKTKKRRPDLFSCKAPSKNDSKTDSCFQETE